MLTLLYHMIDTNTLLQDHLPLIPPLTLHLLYPRGTCRARHGKQRNRHTTTSSAGVVAARLRVTRHDGAVLGQQQRRALRPGVGRPDHYSCRDVLRMQVC